MTQKVVLILSLVIALSISPAFGQIDEIRELAEDTIDSVYDDVMDAVVIPEDNPLNTTPEEVQAVKDDGKEFLKALLNMFGVTHSLAQSGVSAIAPIDLDPWMTGLIGIAVVAIVLVPTLKKIGLDLFKIFILSLVGVVIFVVIGLIY